MTSRMLTSVCTLFFLLGACTRPAPTESPTSPLAVEASTRMALPVLVKVDLLNNDWQLGEEYDGTCNGGSCPGNVRVPTFWDLTWLNQKPCELGSTFKTGQPEARLTDPWQDPDRGHSFMWFTFWRCQHVWLSQDIPEAFVGRTVVVKALAQVWYSDCGSEPFGPPLQSDCVSGWDGNLRLRINGSVWATAYCHYNPCWHIVSSEAFVVVPGSKAIIETQSDLPAKHENVYINRVWMEVIQ